MWASDNRQQRSHGRGYQKFNAPDPPPPSAAAERADLDQGARLGAADNGNVEWQPIVTAPFDCDLELAVLDRALMHAFVFPCRRTRDGWINTKAGRPMIVAVTHWREWQHKDD